MDDVLKYLIQVHDKGGEYMPVRDNKKCFVIYMIKN